MLQARALLLAVVLTAPVLAGCLEDPPAAEDVTDLPGPVRPVAVDVYALQAAVDLEVVRETPQEELTAAETLDTFAGRGAMSLWLQPEPEPSPGVFMQTEATCPGVSLLLGEDRAVTARFTDAACGDRLTLTSEPLPAGAWTHLAVEWAEGGDASLRLDGAPAASAPFPDAGGAASARTKIGGLVDAGAVYDVRVWNGPLGPDLTEKLAAHPPAPSDGPTPVAALATRGPRNFTLHGENTTVPPGTLDRGAITLWLKPRVVSSGYPIVSVFPVDGACDTVRLRLTPSGTSVENRGLQGTVEESGCDGASAETSKVPISPTAWTHVTLNWARGDRIEVWVNGELAARADATALAPHAPVAEARLMVFAQRDTGAYHNVTLWDGPLSADHIRRLVEDAADPLERPVREPTPEPEPKESPRPRRLAALATPDPVDLAEWHFARLDDAPADRGALSFWVRPQAPGELAPFLRVNTTGPCAAAEVALYPNLQLLAGHPMRGCPDGASAASPEVPGGTWTHVAVNWEAGGRLSVWIDGEAVREGPYPARPDEARAVYLALGGYPAGGDALNVTLWDRPLPRAWIEDFAAWGPPAEAPLEPEPEPEPAPAPKGLVAWWPLDAEYDGDPIFEEATGGATYGKKYGAPPLVAAVDGEGYALNTGAPNDRGVGDYLYLPYTPTTLPPEGTLRYLLHLEPGALNATLLSSRSDACVVLHAFVTPQGDLHFTGRPDCESGETWRAGEPGIFPSGTWVNVTLTWDDTGVVLYLNDLAFHGVERIPSEGGHLAIGAMPPVAIGSSAGYYPLIGIVDDIRLYDHALTREELADHPAWR